MFYSSSRKVYTIMKYKFIIMTKQSEKIAGYLDLDEIKKEHYDVDYDYKTV